jgi:6-phosphogluconolactonase
VKIQLYSRVVLGVLLGAVTFAATVQALPATAQPSDYQKESSEKEEQKVKFVKSRDALRGDDTVDWSVLGRPGIPFTALPNNISLTSPKGLGLTVDIAAITATPPGVFPTGPEPGIATAFALGDFLLFTGGENPQFPGLENPSPITISFAKPVFGAGAKFQPDDECETVCPFTGIIQAFDRNNNLLASFSTPGNSSRKLDDSAPFLGVMTGKANISKIVFSIDPAVSGPHPISINALSLVTAKPAGAVYAMTNEAKGNAIVAFSRKSDGTLRPQGNFSTGGQGIGDGPDAEGLGSQGSLVLNENRRWLFAANAGSNDISIFARQSNGLTLVKKVPSGGNRPISLTIHKDLLYVLNYDRIAADCGNITGFKILSEGGLVPLPNSTRPLSTCGANPGQVEFNKTGNLLAVTEKATNLIVTYTVAPDGLASGPITHPSFVENPFSLAFDKRGVLVVSDGFGDKPGEGAASSYLTSPDGRVDLASGAVGNGGAATCWVVIADDGDAYVTNTNSGTISTYNIGNKGKLTLRNGVSASTGNGTKPRDLMLTKDDQFLYTLNSAAGTVSGFKILEDETFVPVGTVSGIPFPGSGGIAGF